MIIGENQNIINCRLGKACVQGLVTAGYTFMVLGIFPVLTTTLSGYIAGSVLIIFGGFLAFTTTGVDLDIKEKRINNYLAYFGVFKINKWIDISGFNYITVVMFNKDHFINNKAKKTKQQNDKNYEVYLVDSSRVNRQIITTFRHAKSAIDYAKKIAVKLEIKYINYQPEKGWD